MPKCETLLTARFNDDYSAISAQRVYPQLRLNEKRDGKKVSKPEQAFLPWSRRLSVIERLTILQRSSVKRQGARDGMTAVLVTT